MTQRQFYHCIFCHNSFTYELLPIFGFATARGCKNCVAVFDAEIKEYWKLLREDVARKKPLKKCLGVK